MKTVVSSNGRIQEDNVSEFKLTSYQRKNAHIDRKGEEKSEL